MQLYSARPAHAMWQGIGDVVAITTIGVAVWLAMIVGDAIRGLGAFGAQLRDAGTGFASTLADAGRALAEVPLIGAGIAQPFVDASGSASDIAEAGTSLQAAVDALATGVSTALWLLPTLLLVVVWLVPRIRFAVRARATATLASTRAGRDLLALRAAVAQPTARVLAVVADPSRAIREGDPIALDRLAALELRSSGVRARRAADAP